MADPRSKNQLQEYFQKKQLSLPSYSTVRVGGGDHTPEWKSVVTLFDGSRFESDIASTKGGAEISAASKALIGVNINLKTKVSIITSNDITKVLDRKTALLVDVENLPKLIDELVSLHNNITNLTVYAFIGEHHCLIDKELPPGTIKVISPSTRPDGTDTCMQVYVGALLVKESYDEYLIATRDHYGSALVEMISAPNLLWTSRPARLVTKISQL